MTKPSGCANTNQICWFSCAWTMPTMLSVPALSGTLMWAGTLSMVGIVHAQLNQHIWFVFAQPLGFVIYIIAAVAEVNRAPFDLPEAEQELTAGYLTEYRSEER